MKILNSFVLLVLYSVAVFSANLHAQETSAVNKETLAKKAFLVIPESLNSNIPGIVESTIYNSIIVKKYYPTADYSRIIDKLNEIAETNKDASIRVKAHLASIYLSFSNIIEIEPKHQLFDHEYLFRQITEQLENKLLVSK